MQSKQICRQKIPRNRAFDVIAIEMTRGLRMSSYATILYVFVAVLSILYYSQCYYNIVMSVCRWKVKSVTVYNRGVYNLL